MRGKVRMHEGKLAMDRITPAYAGKSHGYYTIEVSFLGSPPPMRGKVAPSTPKRKTMRITPAYAGKSVR